MKKIICLVSILAVILLSSCNSLGVVNVIITPIVSTTQTTSIVVPTELTTQTITDSTTTTLPTPIVIKTKEDLLKADTYLFYPYEISFNNYIAGVNQQLWTADDNTPVFGHNAGDVMCIDIYNANDYNTVFSLAYVDEVSPRTFQDGSIVYQPEPRAVNWVTIKNSAITLLPHQLLGIPVSLHVPVGTICQPNWSFEVTVTDETDRTMIYANYGVRFLVNMMQP